MPGAIGRIQKGPQMTQSRTEPPPLPLPVDPNYSGMIPYKNGKALLSYYLGLFSILPAIGMVLGIIALVLGVKGLSAAKAQPQIKGKGHAWAGIITAVVFGGVQWVIAISILISMAGHR